MLDKIAAIYISNLPVGYYAGLAAVAGGKIAEKIPISKFPFLNRVVDVGFTNWLGNEYIAPLTDHFLYRGLLQNFKWQPNFYLQSLARDNYDEYYSKQFSVIYTGMTVFFTIGAAEAAIPIDGKYAFTAVGTSLVTLFPYFYNNEKTLVTKNNGIYFSFEDTILTRAGLMVSHYVVDLAAKMHINGKIKDQASLPMVVGTIYCAVEAYKFFFEEQTLFGIGNALFNDASRVLAFTLAKATGAALVETAKHIPEITSTAIEITVQHPIAAIGVTTASIFLASEENPINYIGKFMFSANDFDFF